MKITDIRTMRLIGPRHHGVDGETGGSIEEYYKLLAK